MEAWSLLVVKAVCIPITLLHSDDCYEANNGARLEILLLIGGTEKLITDITIASSCRVWQEAIHTIIRIDE